MKQLILLLEESQVAKQAKAMGLDYLEFGRYGKNGKMTHKVVNGKLVPATSDEKSGKPPLPKTKSGKLDPSSASKPLPTKYKGKDIAAADSQEYMTTGKIAPKSYPPKTSSKYGVENDPANWWRDAFYANHGRISKEQVAKMMKIHPDLAKSFKELFSDYIKKDKSGNYEWPEMITLGI